MRALLHVAAAADSPKIEGCRDPARDPARQRPCVRDLGDAHERPRLRGDRREEDDGGDGAEASANAVASVGVVVNESGNHHDSDSDDDDIYSNGAYKSPVNIVIINGRNDHYTSKLFK